MFVQILSQALDKILTDERICTDLQAYLTAFQKDNQYIIVFYYPRGTKANRQRIVIPTDATFHIIFKVFGNDMVGDQLRAFTARVTVGEFVLSYDMVEPCYCFAEVYYTSDMQLSTVDLFLTDTALELYGFEKEAE